MTKERTVNVDNQREWRQFMVDEIREMRREQGSQAVQIAEVKLSVNNLKTKVASIASFIGACVGFFLNLITGQK